MSRSSSGWAARAAVSARRKAADGGAAPSITVSARPILVQARSRARNAWSAWITAASRVTPAVTDGLPSRSAPTQLPNRKNAGTAVGSTPLAAPARTWSKAR